MRVIHKTQTLRQGSLSMKEYMIKFDLLMICCELIESQEKTTYKIKINLSYVKERLDPSTT